MKDWLSTFSYFLKNIYHFITYFLLFYTIFIHKIHNSVTKILFPSLNSNIKKAFLHKICKKACVLNNSMLKYISNDLKLL